MQAVDYDNDNDDTMVGAEELQLLQQMSQQMMQVCVRGKGGVYTTVLPLALLLLVQVLLLLPLLFLLLPPLLLVLLCLI